MGEHEAKVKAAKRILYCLNDAPLKPEFSGIFFNIEAMAEAIVREIEQVEVEREYA